MDEDKKIKNNVKENEEEVTEKEKELIEKEKSLKILEDNLNLENARLKLEEKFLIERQNNLMKMMEENIKKIKKNMDKEVEDLKSKNKDLEDYIEQIKIEKNKYYQEADKVRYLERGKIELEEKLEKKNEEIEKLLSTKKELNSKLEKLYEYKEMEEEKKDIKEKLDDYEELKGKIKRIEDENKNLKFDREKQRGELEKEEMYKQLNSILKDRIAATESEIEYLKNIEKSKGTGKDASGNVFGEIIETQKNDDSQSVCTPYFGDEKFVNGFVNFCEKCGFNYSKTLVRTFLCSLKSSKLTILKGYSGTGKTSLPILFAKYLRAECVVIPVQPNWRTKQDIIGFYNYFTNKFIPTELTKTLLRANVNKNRIFLVVLDEMNLARVEYYFSEFNSKLWLDEEKREIELFEGISKYSEEVEVYVKDNKVKIPNNVFFIGTINEDDSVSPISDKIFDRAQVVEFLETPTSKSRGDLEEADKNIDNKNQYTRYESFVRIKKNDEAKENNIKMEIVDNINELMDEYFGKVIGYRSIAQIERFITNFKNSGGQEFEAMDMQLVSKFIPKIKYLYSDEDKLNLEDIKKKIIEKFESNYKLSKEKANKLNIVLRIEKILKELGD